MTYLILGLCLLAALVASWQLSAEPLWAPKPTGEETIRTLSVTARDIIGTETAGHRDDAPSMPSRLPPGTRTDRHI